MKQKYILNLPIILGLFAISFVGCAKKSESTVEAQPTATETPISDSKAVSESGTNNTEVNPSAGDSAETKDVALEHKPSEAENGVAKEATVISGSDNDEDGDGESDGDIDSALSIPKSEVNKPDKYGNTPLCYADNYAEAKQLIDAGANVNFEDKDKQTPMFMLALDCDDPEIITLLIKSGANPNHKNKSGDTPLFWAGSAGVVKALVAGGAKINEINNLEETALYTAKNKEVAQALIDAGVDIYYSDSDGITAEDEYKSSTDKDSREILRVIQEAKKARAVNASEVPFVVSDTQQAGSVNPEIAKQAVELPAVVPSENVAGAEPNTGTEANSIIPSNNAPIVQTTVIPEATGSIVCEKWGSNALFVDGSEFRYKIEIERSNNVDEEGFEPSLEFYIMCKSSLKYASESFCGAELKCDLEPKYNNEKYKDAIEHHINIEGMWFVDSNGYYHPDGYKGLVKTAQVGSCKSLKYIRCEPGTLAYEYEYFKSNEPLIPTTPGVKVYEETDDDYGTSKLTVSRTGTVLCYHSAFDGSDLSVDDICVDDTKGPSSFKYEFSGGSEFMIKGSMRPIKKK